MAGIKQITDVIYLNLSITYYYIEISRFRRAAGCSYDYTIDILGKDLNRYRLSIVLERNEEKELIKFLKDKNIEVILKYYDNKHDGD